MLLYLPLPLHHITRYVAIDVCAFSLASYSVAMFICIPASYYVAILSIVV